MEYYHLLQDRRYNTNCIPHIQKFNAIGMRKDFTTKNCYKIKDVNTAIVSSPNPLAYIDLIDEQVFFISNEMKSVFLFYEPSLQFKRFCLRNQKANRGESRDYYAPIFREIDCLSPRSKYNLDKSHFDHMVIFKRKISHCPIFCVGRINAEAVIVRLDVVESLLRRKLRGLKFYPVEVEENGD